MRGGDTEFRAASWKHMAARLEAKGLEETGMSRPASSGGISQGLLQLCSSKSIQRDLSVISLFPQQPQPESAFAWQQFPVSRYELPLVTFQLEKKKKPSRSHVFNTSTLYSAVRANRLQRRTNMNNIFWFLCRHSVPTPTVIRSQREDGNHVSSLFLTLLGRT